MVETYQVEWELDHLLNLVGRLKIDRILEIGCYQGGTLWHWLQLADTVVAIDDECRNVEAWETWAQTGADLRVVRGSSQHRDIVEFAREYGPYDFVFIDADHTLEAVRADWVNYSPMVADGGAIAFHDILPRPGYGVSQVWDEVKAIDGVRYIEIAQNRVESGNEGRCGIGVAWLP